MLLPLFSNLFYHLRVPFAFLSVLVFLILFNSISSLLLCANLLYPCFSACLLPFLHSCHQTLPCTTLSKKEKNKFLLLTIPSLTVTALPWELLLLPSVSQRLSWLEIPQRGCVWIQLFRWMILIHSILILIHYVSVFSNLFVSACMRHIK